MFGVWCVCGVCVVGGGGCWEADCGPHGQLLNAEASSKSGNWRPDSLQKVSPPPSDDQTTGIGRNPKPMGHHTSSRPTGICSGIFRHLLLCFFQNAFLPPMGPPLAEFGRYTGVRKLVPVGTFWAQFGPRRGPNKSRKNPKHFLEHPCALPPFALTPFENLWTKRGNPGP